MSISKLKTYRLHFLLALVSFIECKELVKRNCPPNRIDFKILFRIIRDDMITHELKTIWMKWNALLAHVRNASFNPSIRPLVFDGAHEEVKINHWTNLFASTGCRIITISIWHLHIRIPSTPKSLLLCEVQQSQFCNFAMYGMYFQFRTQRKREKNRAIRTFAFWHESKNCAHLLL